MKKAKLIDVAEAAGVNISTVSRALQDSSLISQETKEHVLKVAKELGYQIKIRRPMLIEEKAMGIIIPEIMSDYYTRLANLARISFMERDYQPILQITDFDETEMMNAFIRLKEYQVKCILCMADDSEKINREFTERVSKLNIPTMFITANSVPNMDFDCLYIDEKRGTQMAIEHLIENGYKRIGFIGGSNTQKRFHNYVQSLEDNSLSTYKKFCKIGEERAERGGYLRMKELLEQDELPDAVYAGYDQMAIGALYAMHEHGLKAPDDIAVIAFDDIPAAKYVFGGLTTIANPYEDMISIATKLLLRRIEYPRTTIQRVALKPSLMVRKTTISCD